MRKVFLYCSAISLIIFILAGCSEQTDASPVFSTDNDSFVASPQEIIDYLNEGMDDGLIRIPDYQKSYEDIKIAGTRLTITFGESEKNTRSIRLYWADSASKEAITTAGYVSSALIGALCDNDVDNTLNTINKAVKNKSNTKISAGSVSVEYSAFGSQGNSLEFRPNSDPT